MIEITEADITKSWDGDILSPILSICCRTYNLENFVAEAMDSFLMQQTNFPFEIIIDDDHSTDGTATVIRQYVDKFPRIVKANLRKKNVGLRKNFVENMQRAKGKYIALCDGDDFWADPLKIQKQVDFLESNHKYILTYTAMETFHEKDTTQRLVTSSTNDKTSLEIQQHRLNTGSCTVCFRNVDIIKDYPFEYHCSPSNDHFLYSLLGGYGKGKFLEDIKPAQYRLHSDGDYTGKTEEERRILHQQTDYALYMYYLRIGNVQLKEYFFSQVMISFVEEYGKWYFVKKILGRTPLPRVLSRIKGILKLNK